MEEIKILCNISYIPITILQHMQRTYFISKLLQEIQEIPIQKRGKNIFILLFHNLTSQLHSEYIENLVSSSMNLNLVFDSLQTHCPAESI